MASINITKLCGVVVGKEFGGLKFVREGTDLHFFEQALSRRQLVDTY